MAKLDICVLTAGRFDLLKPCIEAIEAEMANTSTQCNLYIFDNGSDSKEAAKFQHLFTRPSITKYKRVHKNRGYPYGANSAISMGNSPLVLFVSDDVMLMPGAIDSLMNTMKNPRIGLCGLKLLFPKFSSDPARPAGKVQHVGHTINLRGEIIHPFVGWSADNPRTCISREVFSVTGAAFIVSREAFRKVRGFDEVYGLGYMEDVELCLHLRQSGYIIYIDAKAVAEHHVGATFTSRDEGSPINQNKAIFMARNKQFITWTDWEIR